MMPVDIGRNPNGMERLFYSYVKIDSAGLVIEGFVYRVRRASYASARNCQIKIS